MLRSLSLLRTGRSYATSAGNILVIVEHSGGQVNASTLSTISAAQKIGSKITALVAGSKVDAVAKTVSTIDGVSQVITAEGENLAQGLPEVITPLIIEVQKSTNATHIVSPHSAFGKSVLPRVAALLDSSQISDVISVESSDTFKRPIYAGNAIATVSTPDPIKVVTVRPTAFPKAKVGGNNASIEKFTGSFTPKQGSKWVSSELSKSDRPDLQTANKVVAGGRALKSAENFKIIYDLADTMGAAVGASRAAVDAGYVSNDLQIGQTGKIIAPDLYIGFGISGAIQHVAGMKDSKVIVCVNKDPEAPLFQIADLGLVEDLFKAVPEMTQKLKK